MSSKHSLVTVIQLDTRRNILHCPRLKRPERQLVAAFVVINIIFFQKSYITVIILIFT